MASLSFVSEHYYVCPRARRERIAMRMSQRDRVSVFAISSRFGEMIRFRYAPRE